MYKMICLVVIAGYLLLSCTKNETTVLQQTNFIPDSLKGKWVLSNLDSTINFHDVQVINKRIVYMGDNLGRVWKTTDGGANWLKLIIPTGNISAIHFLDSLVGFVICGSQVSITEDGGASWRNVVVQQYGAGAPNDVFFINRLVGFTSFVSAGYQSGALFKTINGGITWQQKSGNRPYDMFFVSPQRGWYTNYDGQLYQTNDGGETWAITAAGSGNNNLHPKNHGLHASDTGNVITGNGGGLFHRNTNDGSLVFTPYFPPPGDPYLFATSCYMLSKTTGYYISGNQFIYKFNFANAAAPVKFDTAYQNYPFWNAMSFYDSTFGIICGDFGKIAIMQQ